MCNESFNTNGIHNKYDKFQDKFQDKFHIFFQTSFFKLRAVAKGQRNNYFLHFSSYSICSNFHTSFFFFFKFSTSFFFFQATAATTFSIFPNNKNNLQKIPKYLDNEEHIDETENRIFKIKKVLDFAFFLIIHMLILSYLYNSTLL